jgi:hypothetical protein
MSTLKPKPGSAQLLVQLPQTIVPIIPVLIYTRPTIAFACFTPVATLHRPHCQAVRHAAMAIAHLLGALTGVGMTCFKNGLCSLPYYRKPWEHVISATALAYTFQWVVEKEDEMVAQIETYYASLAASRNS